jgi:hypothetical protein
MSARSLFAPHVRKSKRIENRENQTILPVEGHFGLQLRHAIHH